MNDNKMKNRASFIEMLMIVCGITGLFSAMMWNFLYFKEGVQDNWIWFSRFSFAIICFGFAGIMRTIRRYGVRK